MGNNEMQKCFMLGKCIYGNYFREYFFNNLKIGDIDKLNYSVREFIYIRVYGANFQIK